METTTQKKTLSRESLIMPKIVRASTIHAYYSDCSEGKPSISPTTTDCMESCFNRIYYACIEKREVNVRLFVLKDHNLTEKDIKHWVIFCNRCGFKCEYDEQPTDGIYVGSIIFRSKDYVSYVHMKLGITSVRYICMHYNQGYEEIPKIATELYQKFEQLDAYQVFILAHFGQSRGTYFDSGHGVVQFNNGCPTLISKERMLEKVGDKNACVINIMCSDYTKELNPIALVTLAQEGKWEQVIKMLIK